MADIRAREAKLIQYLNEAYGKEKQLETALEAHIAMTTKAPYKKRLQQHLQETKGHARGVERRIKQLGGEAETSSIPGPGILGEAASTVQEVAHRGAALAQGPIHAVRGTGEEEKLLKNAKTEFTDEHEEIANYAAIQSLAENVGDRETAQLARGIRREEERMASFLERLIPQLTKAVAQAEIPAAERRNGGVRRRSTSRRSGGSTSSRARAGSSRSRGTTSRGRASSSSRSRSGTTSRGRASSSSRGRASSSSRASTSSRGRGGSSSRRGTTASRSSGTRRSSARSASGRSTGARSSGRASAARRSSARAGSTRRSTGSRTTSRASGRSSSRRSSSRS